MHRSTSDLENDLPDIAQSPSDNGPIEMIVRRPTEDERELVDSGELDAETGLVGDNWLARGSAAMPDGAAHPLAQLTLMNSRVADAVAGSRDRWPLAGDQVYVDLDLSFDNLPAGTQLSIGEAIIEVTEKPHTGCAKFSARFGAEALRFVNIGHGRQHRFRGVNTRVVEGGPIRLGDKVSKLTA